MKIYSLKSFVTLAALALASSLPAAILTVDNNPGAVAMYTNLTDAYNAASNSDTILIAGSNTGYGTLSVYKPLTFVGPGYFLTGAPGLTTNEASTSLSFYNDTLKGNSSGSKMIGLSGSVTISSNTTGVVIERSKFGASINAPVVIRDSYGSGSISFNSGSEGSVITNSVCTIIYLYTVNISVDRCVIFGVFSGNPNTSVSNTIFVFSSSSNFSQSSTSISNCMAVGFSTLPAGGGNINGQLVGNVFVNTGNDDAKYQLKAGSPALGAGTGGSDMGAFGGANPYILSGLPDMPRLTRLVVGATATSTSGLQFEVDAVALPQ